MMRCATGALLMFCVGGLFISSSPHKFYVSKTTINFNDRTKIFEVTSKFFTDDLERVLVQGRDESLHLGKENEDARVEALLENYLSDHLKIAINDEPITLRYVGKEVESDLTYCYLEFFRNPQVTSIKIENTSMFELFPDQQNIVDFSLNSSTNTIILLKSKPFETILR